jgi:hypothetical protein
MLGVVGCAMLAPGSSEAMAVVHRPLAESGPAHIGLSHLTTVGSTNWSGYADTQTTSSYTFVQGSWTQPTATCTSGTRRLFGGGGQYSSFWVGMDGYSSNTVEQIGTEADCNGRTPSYYAWYEMYPSNSVNLSTTTYPVRPGDHLTASVSAPGTTFTLTLTDSSEIPNWTKTVSIVSAGAAKSSVEWIAEAPSLCSWFSCTVAPLTNFGTVSFTNATANGTTAPISAFPDSELVMVTNQNTVKALPSALSNAGNGFSDTWYHS